jgi:hypothetical protein
MVVADYRGAGRNLRCMCLRQHRDQHNNHGEAEELGRE